jgi:twitching motility protein PilT
MAQEIMIVTPAIANLIRESKAAQIYSTIQTSSESGMQTLEAALANLVNSGLVTVENAMAKSSKPAELQRLLKR